MKRPNEEGSRFNDATEQTRILREVLKWIRFSGSREVKTVLNDTLTTEQEKVAYQASNGSRGTREVARVAGYSSKSTIERLWKIWRRLGLGDSYRVKGGGERFKRSFDLTDFGIALPAGKRKILAKDESFEMSEEK